MFSHLSVTDLVVVALCALCFYLLRAWTSASKNAKRLPPGPPRRFLIGNLLDLPKELDWLHWAKFKELYGPISSVSVFNQNIIIVNDFNIAQDLLEKKSAIYSDRPKVVFGGEMIGWGKTTSLLDYGPELKAQRRNFHQMMGTAKSVSKFHHLEDMEGKRFIKRVIQNPEKLEQLIRVEAGSLILKVTYGYSAEPSTSDPLISLADRAMNQFSMSVQHSAWVVNSIPILRYLPEWFPGADFKKIAKEWKSTLNAFATTPYEFVKLQMASGMAPPSFVSSLLEEQKTEEEMRIIKGTALGLYAGGSDTTVSALYSFFLAMTLFPEVQVKAREEIDRVIGSDRLPTFEDRPNLPFTDALVKETLRWGTVVPLGMPHIVKEDDQYMSYHIPQGSVITPNMWFLLHDPEVYNDPGTFKPERHLSSKDGKGPERDPRLICYGFGRRICPGKELADTSLFITIALIVATLNISKARDENGNEITPPWDVTTGIISHPKPFKCHITARSLKAASLIDHANDEVPQELEGSDAALLLRYHKEHNLVL